MMTKCNIPVGWARRLCPRGGVSLHASKDGWVVILALDKFMHLINGSSATRIAVIDIQMGQPGIEAEDRKGHIGYAMDQVVRLCK